MFNILPTRPKNYYEYFDKKKGEQQLISKEIYFLKKYT